MQLHELRRIYEESSAYLSSEPWSIKAYFTNSSLIIKLAASFDWIILSHIIIWFNVYRCHYEWQLTIVHCKHFTLILDSYSATTKTKSCFKFQWKAGRKSVRNNNHSILLRYRPSTLIVKHWPATKSKLIRARSTPPWFRLYFMIDQYSFRRGSSFFRPNQANLQWPQSIDLKCFDDWFPSMKESATDGNNIE